ncbi:MAG TPA: EamA family transporter RarD [Roseiflexaceae bacterium]|nr:EamA family transporter RarD [Roseiflexaceae bacterium]
MNKGIFYAAGAYIAWGLLPIYWKALHHASVFEILAHRIVWALLIALGLLAARRHWAWLGQALRSGRTLLAFAASALLLSVNWFVYIWAVNAGNIVETSLGYFINPLVNVLLGVLFLKERLRPGQGLAVAVALAGVLYLTVLYGSFPAIAVALALSFGLYGLLRKTAALGALEGFTLETLLLVPPALAYLGYREAMGAATFTFADPLTALLLVGAGGVTAAPLLLFAVGARRIQLTTLGIIQYMAPTLQFAIGVLLYGEPLSPQRLAGFVLIWIALAIYTLEGALRVRRRPSVTAPSPASSQ